MRTWTAMISWLEVGRRGNYILKRKTLQGIRAESFSEASDKALATIAGKILPALNCLRYDWPQPPITD